MVHGYNRHMARGARTSSEQTAAVDAVDDVDDVDALIADVFARNCPSRTVMENVSSKWGILALAALTDGPYRFGALRRRVDGVSERMLAQTLQTLERDGMVIRDVQATIPPRVEYSLTPLGTKVAKKLLATIQILEDAVPEVLAARAAYESRH